MKYISLSRSTSISKNQVAIEICDLVNTYNRWSTPFTPQEILNSPTIYIVEIIANKIMGCIGILPINLKNIYYSEIRHLSVYPSIRRMGFGRILLRDALSRIDGTSIVYIKEDNIPSINLFITEGFSLVKKIEKDKSPDIWVLSYCRSNKNDL